MKNILVYLIVIFIFFNCSSSKNKDDNSTNKLDKNRYVNNINSTYNSAYKKSIEEFYGYFDTEDLKLIKEKLQEKSKHKIDFSKTIFIKYLQSGDNCIIEKIVDYATVLKNIKSQNSKLSELHNVESFLIFSPTFFQSYYLNEQKDWILDKGFFKNIIFKKNKNCSSFLAIKPNGNYYLYYGEDSFSEANAALMKKKWRRIKN